MPKIISPELATLVKEPPSGNEWLHELKFDGYRIISFKEGKHVRLMSRNHHDWTHYFSNIQKEISKLSVKKIILDGEVVLLDENKKSNFQLLQNSIQSNQKINFVYYVFDILYDEKHNLMTLPLIERKKILNTLIPNTDKTTLRFSAYMIGSGDELFTQACKKGLEGIISKRVDSPYQEKRTKNWLKVRCDQSQEFLVGGYTQPKGSRKYFGSLFLGVYNENKQLIFCGNVGTGFTEDSLKTIYALLQKYKTSHHPFHTNPPGITTAIWVKPKIIVEINFSEWTQEGMLRHPSFKGIRHDKKPDKITREIPLSLKKIVKKKTSNPSSESQSSNLKFPFTNPDKILYPEDHITKLDLAKYYDAIQEWILPFVKNRPLTLVRCPENYKDCFYQKHLHEHFPHMLFEIPIKEKEKERQYVYIKNVKGLFSLVQMGVLEIHTWGCQIKKVDFPDLITFDLDPAPDVEWKKVIETAFVIKKHLDEIQLKSFVKTTGGKGLHIIVPIKPKHDWKTIKHFAHSFVKTLMLHYPDQYLSEASKAKRKGKIFVDYLRNQKGATFIAPYSTRAKIHAPVSIPFNESGGR